VHFFPTVGYMTTGATNMFQTPALNTGTANPPLFRAPPVPDNTKKTPYVTQPVSKGGKRVARRARKAKP
jgi:hypothetical protein